MTDKKTRDYWSECVQIFFHYVKGYGLTEDLNLICLGNEDDVDKCFETGQLSDEFNPTQRQVLNGILDYRKEQGTSARQAFQHALQLDPRQLSASTLI